LGVSFWLAFLAAYILVGSVIALVSRRSLSKGGAGFYVAGYRLGGFLSAMTYAATTYSAFMMIGLVGLSYATGVGALGFECVYLLSTIMLLTLLAPRIRLMASERGWVSPSEMLGDLYGSRCLELLVTVVYLLALIPYVTAQFVGVGSLFEGAGSSYVMGVGLGVVIVLVWSALAGVWSVAATDAFQGLWMISSCILLLAWFFTSLLPKAGIGLQEALGSLGSSGYLGIRPPWSLSVFIAFTLPWMFFALTNPQVLQRLFMPRDRKALERMIVGFSSFGLAYTVMVVLLGLFARALTMKGFLPDLSSSRDLVTPTILSMAPPLLASAVLTGIIAASISTIDSIVLSLASCIETSAKKRRVAGIRILVLTGVAGASALLSLLKPGFVVELSVLSSLLLLPLAPLVILGVMFPEKMRGHGIAATLSLLAGVLLGLTEALRVGARKALIETILGLPLPVWTLLLSLLVLTVCMFVIKRR